MNFKKFTRIVGDVDRSFYLNVDLIYFFGHSTVEYGGKTTVCYKIAESKHHLEVDTCLEETADIICGTSNYEEPVDVMKEEPLKEDTDYCPKCEAPEGSPHEVNCPGDDFNIDNPTEDCLLCMERHPVKTKCYNTPKKDTCPKCEAPKGGLHDLHCTFVDDNNPYSDGTFRGRSIQKDDNVPDMITVQLDISRGDLTTTEMLQEIEETLNDANLNTDGNMILSATYFPIPTKLV